MFSEVNDIILVDNEFKSLIPPLGTEEYEQLEKNCIADGIRDPIVLWENDGIYVLLDGHNRYEIAKKHNLKYNVYEKQFESREEAICYIIDNQLGRRNITNEQKSYLIGLRYRQEKKRIGEHDGNQYTEKECTQNGYIPNRTSERIAEQVGVSKNTVIRAAEYSQAVDTISENTSEEIKREILTGKTKLTQDEVKALAELPSETQKEILSKPVKEIRPMLQRFTRKEEMMNIFDINFMLKYLQPLQKQFDYSYKFLDRLIHAPRAYFFLLNRIKELKFIIDNAVGIDGRWENCPACNGTTHVYSGNTQLTCRYCENMRGKVPETVVEEIKMDCKKALSERQI